MKKPYRFWTRIDFNKHLHAQVKHYKLGEDVLSMVNDALDDDSWNPSEQFDGCTLVQDFIHPSLPCFLHDHHWITGMGGWKSNIIFYRLMLATGVKKSEARRRLIGVTIGWYLSYKWKHDKKRNVNPLTKSMVSYLQNKQQ